MNRVQAIVLHLSVAVIVLCTCVVARTCAQTASPSPSPSPESIKEQQADPFAPEPPDPLPPGMTGSETNDPRAHLTPGIYNAGETAMGIKHLLLLKKPNAFQLGADNPDDPKVQKTLGLMGIGDTSKMKKSTQLVRAQLAFANSDLAFQGNHLFQGNFYGIN
ncbi:MAG TPA: hypothetical protein VJW17_07780, partial [Pyrinomonadaceae bacterium]|nr:hypothetical protein [Pyrinomonadaceae bacterium]